MSHSADYFKTLGNKQMKNGNFDAAVDCYKRGLVLEPNNAILLCNMAQAHLNLKNYGEAEIIAAAAIGLQEDNVKAYYRAAKAAILSYNMPASMNYIFQGVKNCDLHDLEELFCLARELSEAFEAYLRDLKKKEMSENNAASSKVNQPRKNAAKENLCGKSETECVPSRKSCRKLEKKEQELYLREVDELVEQKNSELVKEFNGLKSSKELESKHQHQVKKEDKREEYRLKVNNKELKASESKIKTVQLNNDMKGVVEKQRGTEKLDVEHKEHGRIKSEAKALVKGESKKQEIQKKEEVEENKELERKEKERKEMAKKEKDREKKEPEKKERKKTESEGKDREKNLNEKEELERIALEVKMREQEQSKMILESLRKELNHHLKEGSLALMKGLNQKAVNNFKKALDALQSKSSENLKVDEMDVVILNFAFSQALIQSDEYNGIVKAIHTLDNLKKEGNHYKIPAIFLLLGRAFIRLNRFKTAVPALEQGMSLLNIKKKSYPRFSWPGTHEVIEFTNTKVLRTILESELQMCKIYRKPDAVCIYKNCLSNSQHIVPSSYIFFSDPDFIGYIQLVCQEKCHNQFHLSCWKDYKESLSEVEKLVEKDFLGKECLTPDCVVQASAHRAAIVKVVIIGPDGTEKSSCEYSPATVSATPLNHKQIETCDKTPKKKQRKKDSERVERIIYKCTRVDSQSKSNRASGRRQDSTKSHIEDAMLSLAVARKHNFGYHSEAPDPSKVSSFPTEPQLTENEGFVYSYFHEIFKEEPFMFISKLQQHWETSKEFLNGLVPTLITHTDLVKFLLDSGGFAVVQDMIGLASQLPILTSIVEAKSSVPKPMVYALNLSPATVLETRKTLSLSYPQLSSENDCWEETEFNYPLAQTAGNQTNSFGSNINGANGHELTNSPAYSRQDYSSSFEKTEDVLNPSLEQEVSSKMEEEVVEQTFLMNNTVNTSTKETANAPKNVLLIGPELTKDHAIDHSTSKCQVNTDHIEINGKSGQPETAIQSDQKEQWKPRLKIMEWAYKAFPAESRKRLAEALAIVRAQNNNTLSGLSFDVINQRLASVLQT